MLMVLNMSQSWLGSIFPVALPFACSMTNAGKKKKKCRTHRKQMPENQSGVMIYFIL